MRSHGIGGRKSVRVLQVLGSLNMGGAESRMMDVYRKIDRKRLSFDFLIFSQGEQFYEQEAIALGSQVIQQDMPRPGRILRHIHHLRDVLRTGGYDVVHAHTSYHSGLVMYAAWREGVPVRISHARTTETRRKGVLQRAMLILGRSLIHRFATVRLAISEKAGRFLFGRSSFVVLPNAIDVRIYQNTEDSEASALRGELCIPGEAVVVGQIGRLEPMKNHAFTLAWFADYCHGNPNAILVLVGDGSLRAGLEQKATDLGIRDKVHFTGVRGDVPRLIHIFDTMIFPSIFEGLGGVVLEAQAAGIPTVMSDTVPDEADMGLGLIKRCSLEAGFDVWTKAIEESIVRPRPDYKRINAAFGARGYSLEHEIARLEELYTKGIA